MTSAAFARVEMINTRLKHEGYLSLVRLVQYQEDGTTYRDSPEMQVDVTYDDADDDVRIRDRADHHVLFEHRFPLPPGCTAPQRMSTLFWDHATRVTVLFHHAYGCGEAHELEPVVFRLP